MTRPIAIRAHHWDATLQIMRRLPTAADVMRMARRETVQVWIALGRVANDNREERR
jgi:hypothetical protein